MKQKVKRCIKVELCSYWCNKEIIAQIKLLDLFAHRQLLRSAIMIHVIESALAELPQEIKEYTTKKYFNKRNVSYAMLADECHASERTLKRWDDILLKTIARHMRALGKLVLTCQLCGTMLAPQETTDVLEYKQQENDRARYTLVIKSKGQEDNYMAVTKTVENTILSLKSQVGTMANGKPRYKTNSYSNIATTATDADMHFVASRLATLFQADIAKITRQDICDLLEESED